MQVYKQWNKASVQLRARGAEINGFQDLLSLRDNCFIRSAHVSREIKRDHLLI